VMVRMTARTRVMKGIVVRFRTVVILLELYDKRINNNNVQSNSIYIEKRTHFITIPFFKLRSLSM
jgi:hypothetical protein